MPVITNIYRTFLNSLAIRNGSTVIAYNKIILNGVFIYFFLSPQYIDQYLWTYIIYLSYTQCPITYTLSKRYSTNKKVRAKPTEVLISNLNHSASKHGNKNIFIDHSRNRFHVDAMLQQQTPGK